MTPRMTSFRAIASFTHAGLLGSAEFPPIAYALYAPERAARGLPLYGMMGEHATLVLALIGDPQLRELGASGLARAMFDELAPGATWHYERRLHVVGQREIAALDAAVRLEIEGGTPDSGVAGTVEIAGRPAISTVPATPESGVPPSISRRTAASSAAISRCPTTCSRRS